MSTRSVLSAALMLLAACRPRHTPVAPELARGPARDSLFRLDQTRGDSVAARGGVEGVIALFSPSVIYLRAGLPTIYGREAARTLFASAPAIGTWMWQPLGGGISNDLRHAYTYGVAAHAGASQKPLRLERYIAYWTREPGEPWRIQAYAEVNGQSAPEVAFAPDQLEPPTDPLSRQLARVTAAVRAADSLFSDRADRMGTGFAFSNTIAAEGVMFGPTQLIVGPRAADEYFRAQPAGTSLTWRPVYAFVAASGDLGFTVGESIQTGRGPSGAAVQRFGKYLTVWQKQRDGSWKFVVDGGSSSPPKNVRD